jgi:hypothetical protein
MKTCATCNASHKNTVERVLRCMGCLAKPDGNTNWRPIGHNAQVTVESPVFMAKRPVDCRVMGFNERTKDDERERI